MKHRRLWVFAVILISLGSVTTLALRSETVLVWLFHQAVRVIPAEVTVQSIHGRLAGPIEIQGLQYADKSSRVEIQTLQLSWRPIKLLTGVLDITRLHIEHLDIHLAATDQTDTSTPGKTRLAVPLAIKLGHSSVRHIRLLRNDKLVTVIPGLDIAAQADDKQLKLSTLQLQLDRGRVSLAGHLGAHAPHPLDLTSQWHWQGADTPPLSGRGTLRGNLTQLKLEQFLETPSQARLSAVIDRPLSALHWQAQLDMTPFELEKWRPSSADLRLAGQLQAEGDLTRFDWQGRFHAGGPLLAGKVEGTANGSYQTRRLHLDKMSLQHNNRRSKLSLRGDLELRADMPFTLEGNWHELLWPLEGQAQLRSPRGSYALQGSLAEYRFKSEAALYGAAVPPGQWQFVGTGNRAGLRIDTLKGEVLDGEITGDMQVSWSARPGWQLQLQGKQIDPASYWPVQHGRLAAGLHSRGEIKHGVIEAEATIQNLRGSLHKQPVTGEVRLQMDGNRFHLPRFEISVGHSRLDVSGRLSDDWDLQWRLEAPDLAVISPYTTGQLKSQGRLSGPRLTPRINANLHGDKFSAADAYYIASVDAEFDVDISGARPSQVNSTAHDVRFREYVLNTLSLTALSLGQVLKLDLTAEGDDLAASLHASGPFQGGRWSGRLTHADFKTPRVSEWRLSAPADFVLARGEVRLGPACWSAAEARFCLDLQQAPPRDWQITLSGRQFPLAFAEWFTPAGIRLTGHVDGHADLTLRDRHISGRSQWVFSPGRILYSSLNTTEVRQEYRGGRVEIRQDKDALQGEIKLDIDPANELRLGFTLPAILLTPEPNLTGRDFTVEVQARIAQLTWLSLIFPEVIEPTGSFNADFRVSGTTARPRFAGYARLEQVGAALPDLGITLKQLNLTARAKNASTVQLTGQAYSGDGQVRLRGEWQLDADKGRPLQVRLLGKQFEVVHTAEARVVVTPDLKITLAGHRVDITGRVKIPHAKLEPVGLPEGVTISRDAVITGGEPGRDASHYKAWDIYSRVRIILGDDVHFNGFGLRGRLSGEVLAVDTPQTLTTGTGELMIHNGRYRVHGENLEVDPGRLVFAGGPIDDPGLDARALRRLDEVVAGVQVRGTLKAPKLTLFSEPVMRESDILAYIVLGRPLDQTTRSEAGLLIGVSSLLNFTGSRGLNDQIANRFGLEEISLKPGANPEDGVSLVLGKYLSPRLYVSYMIGLVDSVSTVRIRYKLGKRVSLQGESSSKQSGADILYTIER